MDLQHGYPDLPAGFPVVKGWHAGRILFALARRFDWWSFRCATEFQIDGYQADFVTVSRAGYLTEVEIKISRKDWRAPKELRKALAIETRPHIARFFYAVPETLFSQGVPFAQQIPSFVPPWAGVLVCCGDGVGYDSVREVRAAKRFDAQPLTPELQLQMLEGFYYRYWRQKMDMERQRLFERKVA